MATTAPEDERVVAAAALAAAEEQLQSWTASHAGTFVEAERRARSFQQGLQSLLQQLGELEAIPKNMNMEENSLKISELSEQHRVRRRTLLQHGSLLELLELPALMDACVRSQLYEEALQIAAFANTLSRRHPTARNDCTAVHAVIQQIRSRQADLRRHLMARLRQTVTMPECLETVTAVRRLHQIELEERGNNVQNLERAHTAMEYQLQIDFLEARDVWVDNRRSGSSLDNNFEMSSSGRPRLHHPHNPQDEPVLDAIERYRTRMFEVATQFNAIFRAEQHPKQTQQSAATTKLLSLWMARRVQLFHKLLQTQLLSDVQQADATSGVRDCLEAAVFFATSLGRLGGDFTPQLAELLESLVLQTVTQYWKDGVAQLQETLTVCRDAGVAGPLTAEQDDEDQDHDDDDDEASSLEEPQAPPKKLLALPPLARFVNAVLTGLNELRRCLLPGLFPALRRALEAQLQAAQQLLRTNERAVMVPGLRGEAGALRDAAVALQTAWTELVEPYLRGSLEAAVGNRTAARQQHVWLRGNLRAAVEEKRRESALLQQQEEEEQEKEAAAMEEEEVVADDKEGEELQDDDDDAPLQEDVHNTEDDDEAVDPEEAVPDETNAAPKDD